METYTAQQRAYLLKVARSEIESSLVSDREASRGAEEKHPAVLEKRGCFVTLHKRGALRGCIGTIAPVDPLIFSVKKNALNAAFSDPRFPSLTVEELREIKIEISVLSVPEPLEYTDGEDLKRKLIPGVHGVILSRGHHSATFLPQVWEQLKDKTSFLSHLSMKAGLPRDAWQDKATQIKIYTVEYFHE